MGQVHTQGANAARGGLGSDHAIDTSSVQGLSGVNDACQIRVADCQGDAWGASSSSLELEASWSCASRRRQSSPENCASLGEGDTRAIPRTQVDAHQMVRTTKRVKGDLSAFAGD